MVFTLTYWASEIEVFQKSFADQGTSEKVLGLLVRGICYLAAHTSKNNPEAAKEILKQFKDCMAIAEARMGPGWFVQNAVIISTHCDSD
jgi:hypothetical protein